MSLDRKKTYMQQDTQARVLHRLKIVRGHLDKVITMVEQQEYCMDILYQTLAVENALKEVDALVLENHLLTCASDAIRGEEEKREAAVQEIVKMFKRSR